MCKRIMIVDDALRAIFHALGRHIGIRPGKIKSLISLNFKSQKIEAIYVYNHYIFKNNRTITFSGIQLLYLF